MSVVVTVNISSLARAMFNMPWAYAGAMPGTKTVGSGQMFHTDARPIPLTGAFATITIKPNELRELKIVNREEKIRLLRIHQKECEIKSQEWKRRGYRCPPPNYPPLPPELVDMTCGAKTRAGTPCKQLVLYRGGRCKFHGGLSTGPRTEEGKAKSAQNGFKPGWSNTKPMEG
ncbi:HGGxSTG domain-containing protein [Desulfoferula mesophila]|uniref:HGGxSTG domain-containing protein n=1 Tax=Desulfoferula mesophila TaxID=3058419 RepID=UPI0033130710